MTTQKNKPQRYLNPETEQFPVYYEDDTMLVFENGSGEIFVENKTTKIGCGRVSLRISPWGADLKVWANKGSFAAVREVQLCAV